ncbi:DNA cytosine methyltransferase [Aurantimonas sp. VKM B-3413]|uniref:DNA cytosine methyltransferase n=1 Tax=Aurantimonas sp. VKM B-3413 TaxID=2779401 RepID=UPI00351CBCDC|nr:DNA cytosine methyltransferase [Aurantimonas sp. VKM B-3413]
MRERLRALSTCSEISAASAAWGEDAFEFVAFADIDPFAAEWPSQRRGCGRPRHISAADEPLLSTKEAKARKAAIKAVSRIPAAGRPQNCGDFTRISDDELRALGPVDVLEGGTPCQDFSVAGLRAGLAGDRGNLTLEFIKLAKRMEVINGLRYVVWENVPGCSPIPQPSAPSWQISPGAPACRSSRQGDRGPCRSGRWTRSVNRLEGPRRPIFRLGQRRERVLGRTPRSRARGGTPQVWRRIARIERAVIMPDRCGVGRGGVKAGAARGRPDG